MANFWKLGREMGRLKQQLGAVAEVFSEPRRQARYDADRLSHLSVSDGAIAVAGRIALLVIYQPLGVAPSVLHTCRHLAAKGYAPLVISNAVLSTGDRAALGPLVWRLGERPNYGYDFGAYRDGILALRDWGIRPDTLLILNDSVWFPLHAEDDLIARLEALDADLAGTILRSRAKSRLWRDPALTVFLESYCYRLNKAALAHPAFAAFWGRYRMTDNKYKVIRRGERDFSMAMRAAGLTVAPVLTEAAFRATVAGFDAEGLRRTVLYGAHSDDRIEAERSAILADFAGSDAWRSQALAHVDRALGRGVFNSAFCYPTLGAMRAGYLKKSGERINRLWRSRYRDAVAAGHLPEPAAAVWSEVLARD